ncbi:MAG: hypothetical protein WBI83_09335 [bacterium]|jgi:hypothetical protein|nr:hypothetical protein [Bacillota bacterium]HHW54265.1 hypothetical protein [Bacillota bacterium]
MEKGELQALQILCPGQGKKAEKYAGLDSKLAAPLQVTITEVDLYRQQEEKDQDS